MSKRCVALGFVTVLLLALVSGCGSKMAFTTDVSVNNDTREATIKISTFAYPLKFVTLILTYPDGHTEVATDGTIGPGGRGAGLTAGDLPPGEYTYTVYALPLENQDPKSVPGDKLAKEGGMISGKFVIP